MARDDATTDAPALAVAVRSPRLARVSGTAYLVIAALWLWPAVRDGDVGRGVVGGLWVVLAVAWLVLGSGPRARLVLDDDVLRLVRPLRPWSVRRADVVAVRGDVPGRPTWSGSLVLETRDGSHRVSGLEPGPAVLVPRLQEWAGVGETARTSPPEG